MVFSSIIFLFLFLPVTLAIYFITPKHYRNFVLILTSFIFYSWGEGLYIFILAASIIINYIFALLIEKYRNRSGIWIFCAVTANLGLLGFFKYANFLASNINSFLESFGLGSLFISRIHLPLGISFFTFQALSYVIDVYNKKIPAQRSLLKLGTYISLFPQLAAGPIVRYTDIAKQIANRVTSKSNFSDGALRFLVGLGKKILIANPMAVMVDQIFSIPSAELTTGLAWLGAVGYTLQIYFDFSGYSDMAIGLARILGFRYLENFNYPYISSSIREFWRRWHISLSGWFRDYLYIPLGGNRCGSYRTYLNLIIVFLLCGLWHGANWNFVVWGLFHGFFLVLERTIVGRGIDSLPKPFRHIYALLVVTTGWVVFRAETLPQSIAFIAAMFGFAHGTGARYAAEIYLNKKLIIEFCAAIILSAPIYPFIRERGSHFMKAAPIRIRIPANIVFYVVKLALIILLVYASTITMAITSYTPFIYSKF